MTQLRVNSTNLNSEYYLALIWKQWISSMLIKLQWEPIGSLLSMSKNTIRLLMFKPSLSAKEQKTGMYLEEEITNSLQSTQCLVGGNGQDHTLVLGIHSSDSL